MKTPEDAEVLARGVPGAGARMGSRRGRRRHGHVAAARRRRRERARRRRGGRAPARDVPRAAARPGGAVRGERRWRPRRASPHDEAVARAEHALDGGRGARAVPPHGRGAGRRPPRGRRPARRPARRRRSSSRSKPTGTVRSPPWTRRRSARRASRWARAGCARATRSTPPWGSWCAARSATVSRPGEPIGEVHARSADDAAEAARRVLAALTLTDGDVSAAPARPPLDRGRAS